jgi:protein tyrosine phosphatase (PTP) superfamily phosphohydrolase (DUF442 family)
MFVNIRNLPIQRSRNVEISIRSGAMALRAVAVGIGLCCAGCEGHRPFVATPVAPGLLVGRQPRGQADYEVLRGQGVRTILSLQVMPWDVAYGRSHAETFGFAYRNVPVPASPLEPGEARIKDALALLGDPELRPVFMHCNLGRDRAALLVGLYRVQHEGWTPEAAWDEMLRSGFKVSWWLSGLRKYFWNHSREPARP